MNYLALLASTKNRNCDLIAENRIEAIYQLLKNPSINSKQAESLTKEALRLKGIPSTQLFCLPYAGGSAQQFESWNIGADIWVEPVEYPGRGTKNHLPLIPNFLNLLDHLEEEIQSRIQGPFAIFGHSLGAIIAFELAFRLSTPPERLFVSAASSPDQLANLQRFSMLSDEGFLEAIVSLNGTPAALIETEAFQTYFLPILRNDFNLLDNYKNQEKKLKCPLGVFLGKNDPNVTTTDAERWSHRSNEVHFHEIDGDHFFIHQPNPILQIIRESLCPKPS